MKPYILFISFFLLTITSCSQPKIEDDKIIGTWLELDRDFFAEKDTNYDDFIWEDSLDFSSQKLILNNDGSGFTIFGDSKYETKFVNKNGYLVLTIFLI